MLISRSSDRLNYFLIMQTPCLRFYPTGHGGKICLATSELPFVTKIHKLCIQVNIFLQSSLLEKVHIFFKHLKNILSEAVFISSWYTMWKKISICHPYFLLQKLKLIYLSHHALHYIAQTAPQRVKIGMHKIKRSQKFWKEF